MEETKKMALFSAQQGRLSCIHPAVTSFSARGPAHRGTAAVRNAAYMHPGQGPGNGTCRTHLLLESKIALNPTTCS